MAESKTIYVADDEKNIRDAIKIFLESENYTVRVFENGDQLLQSFVEKPCDLIILDIMMPGRDGFAICREIRKRSTVPIIMLTARDSDLDYATGLSLGSDDYFTKPFSAIALTMRVKAIFRRIAFEQQAPAAETSVHLAFGNIDMDINNKMVQIAGKNVNLTPNEFDVLAYFLKNQDRAVSRDELLEHVWGYQVDIETRATDDTVRRLRKKIEESNVVIEAVWGFGFRLTVQK